MVLTARSSSRALFANSDPQIRHLRSSVVVGLVGAWRRLRARRKSCGREVVVAAEWYFARMRFVVWRTRDARIVAAEGATSGWTQRESSLRREMVL
jgi:hypothetical protein